MKKFSLTLAFIACLLAPSLYFHSAAHAQEKEAISDVRQDELERAQDRERGEVEAEDAAEEDKAIEELPAAGGCSMIPETASGSNSGLFACFWGAAVVTLIVRQRKAG